MYNKPNRKIHSLSDLRRRKEMLQLEMEVTRKAIGTGLKNTQASVKNTFIRAVLIPLGAGGLAALLYKEPEEQAGKPAWLLFLQQMMQKINEQFETPPHDEPVPQAEQQPPSE